MADRTQVLARPSSGDHEDIHSLLEERERLERMVEEKFRKRLTVVFTDLKGSTSMAETYGDLESRSVIKRYHDLAAEAIRANDGVLVKTIGDGTLSHFPTAIGALRASVTIQKGMDEFNLSGKFKMPILVRVGIHTGHCIVEKNDIFGDVVNAASRFESSAHPGEILISEETFQALDDKSEIYCRFRDEIVLKGKKEPVKAYKAFWDPREIEEDLKPTTPAHFPTPPQKMPRWKLALAVAIPLAVVLAITGYIAVRDKPGAAERRSIEQSLPQK
jgi:class 3 adenylate cyclase